MEYLASPAVDMMAFRSMIEAKMMSEMGGGDRGDRGPMGPGDMQGMMGDAMGGMSEMMNQVTAMMASG